MRRSAWMMTGVLLAAAHPCWAQAERVESRISAVTVFPDRASVTRMAALQLSKGAHTVEVAPLPSDVDADSVTARGSGEAEVVLSGVRVVTTQLEAAQDPRVKELQEAIRKGEQADRRLRKQQDVLEQERKYLASIQAASSEQIGKDLITRAPSASDAQALLAFLDEAYTKNLEREEALAAQLEANTRELDRLRRELATLARGQRKQQTAILVDLEAGSAGAFQLAVTYRVPGASWEPAYEARAMTSADQVELVSYGMVRQQTGEDWTDAQVTLSTARPAIAGSLPELQPWFLRPWEPLGARKAQYRREKDASMGAGGPAPVQAGLMNEEAPSAPRPEQEAHVATALVNAQGPSVTFTLPKLASIPADWQPHKVPIGSQRFAASVAYETTPRLLAYAFLHAAVTNTSDAFYLAGPVAVFLDGAFVATAALKQVAPGEAFDLYLGVDERVKVERKQLKEHVEVSLLPGLRGKTTSTDYEFLTMIQNFTSRKITVTAFDQVPVSEREEIVVESVKQTPAEVEKEKEKPGVFHWTLELNPNQKQELRLSYRVRHPVDMQVQ